MKAESIEQIREHLARGGRVVAHIMGSDRAMEYHRVSGQLLFCGVRYTPVGFSEEVVKCWELLPLDEKPTRQYYYRVNGCLAEDSSSETCICWHDEGTGPLKDHPEEIGRWREKPLPGVPASSLPLVTEDPTGESCDNCEHCHGKGGRWDDESIDQWYWCEHCDAAKEYYAKKRCYSVSETLQPIAFRQAKNSRVQILINGNDTGAGERIRKALLFGHIPSMPDLLSWWEATTGEKIEHGRRCEKCGGLGKVPWYGHAMAIDGPIMRPCQKCEDSCGYTVRPTWMGER